jgi:hypothetical protein
VIEILLAAWRAISSRQRFSNSTLRRRPITSSDNRFARKMSSLTSPARRSICTAHPRSRSAFPRLALRKLISLARHHQSGAEATHLATFHALLERHAVGMYAPPVPTDAKESQNYPAMSPIGGRHYLVRMRFLPRPITQSLCNVSHVCEMSFWIGRAIKVEAAGQFDLTSLDAPALHPSPFPNTTTDFPVRIVMKPTCCSYPTRG